MLNEDKSPDIFGFEDPNYVGSCIKGKPAFQRTSTLDEDLIALKKKWRGTDNEVLINHMIDSLILFNHNRKQISDVSTGGKFGSTEVREAIQVQSTS